MKKDDSNHVSEKEIKKKKRMIKTTGRSKEGSGSERSRIKGKNE